MVGPTTKNMDNMWALMEELFPVYRSLAGPGFAESLRVIQNQLPLTINEFPSGKEVFDWTIPKEFKVNASYVISPSGEKILNFDDCSYHVYVYSQPYHGVLTKDELISHISTHHKLRDAVPLRVTYYRDKWGLCASQNQVDALTEGNYEVHIDTEIFDGFLRMGEYYLPGKEKKEILISSYMCHPRGANDNLSGVVVAVELFKLLAQMPNRRYSYRLVIWPETIGSITYIYHYPERLKNMLGGYNLMCLGGNDTSDPLPFIFNASCNKQSIIDRAMRHALKHLNYDFIEKDDFSTPSDERQFNGAGLRIPYGFLLRSSPFIFDYYHTSLDDLNYVHPEVLYKSLHVYWKTITTIEKNRFYQGNSTVEPFLTKYDVYPFDLGGGESGLMSNEETAIKISSAYYALMWAMDGTYDLLEIADNMEYDIDLFDRCVNDFLRVGLMKEIQSKKA